MIATTTPAPPARCRPQADGGSLEVTSRDLTGEVRVFRARREGAAEAEPDAQLTAMPLPPPRGERVAWNNRGDRAVRLPYRHR